MDPMTDQEHLIGFYRRNNKIHPIYSENDEIYDEKLKKIFKAILVPLKTYKNDEPWQLSKNARYMDKGLHELLDEKTVWLTDLEPSRKTHFYALMYTPKENMAMSRTGVLLYESEHGITPILMTINEMDYLLEIKGCGAPTGGFPTLHLQSQSHSFKKTHVKLTGGLTESECKKEYNNLIALNQAYGEGSSNKMIKPLGMSTFEYGDLKLALLIRLIPSSLRASFSRNNKISMIMKRKKKYAYKSMAEQTIKLLQQSPPLLHDNLNLNNMVYVSQNHYSLTDFSEVRSITDPPPTYDYVLNIWPTSTIRKTPKEYEHYLLDYLGIKKGTEKERSPIMNALYLSRKVLEGVSESYYKNRLKEGWGLSSIKMLRTYFTMYYSNSFFVQSTKEWVETELIPIFQLKLTVLEELIKNEDKLKDEDIKMLMKGEKVKGFSSIVKKLSQLRDARNAIKGEPLTSALVGQLSCDLNLRLEFIVTISSMSEVRKNYAIVNEMHKKMTSIRKTNYQQLPSTDDIISMTYVSHQMCVEYLMYPHFFMFIVFYETEKLLLTNDLEREDLQKDEKAHIVELLQLLKDRYHYFRNNVDYIKQTWLSDPETFHGYFQW